MDYNTLDNFVDNFKGTLRNVARKPQYALPALVLALQACGPVNTPEPNTPEPTKTYTAEPTNTLEPTDTPFPTDTATATPTPEAAGGPFELVMNYGNVGQWGFEQSEDGFYRPVEDYFPLGFTQGHTSWLEFINPSDGLEVKVADEFNDCNIVLDSREAFEDYIGFNCNYTGLRELEVVATIQDQEYELRIPVYVSEAQQDDGNGNGGGNGGGGDDPVPTQKPRPSPTPGT